MQATLTGIGALVVLIILLLIWVKVIKPRRDKNARDAAKELAAEIRKAENSRNDSMMMNVLDVLSSEAMDIESIVAALEARTGDTVSPIDVSRALTWERARQTRCRVEVVRGKGFVKKNS